MRIVTATTPGGPEVLVVREAETPRPLNTQVLIKVHAAGLNRADLLQRQGKYPPPSGAPDHPGLEVAGEVVECGANVTEFTVGQKVCALLAGGGYAEYCVADAGQVLAIPENMSFVDAAALPEACFTVWTNVFEIGGLAQGESLLVHGGTSGIGVMAIQIAVARGHATFATAGSLEKVRYCEELGARKAINYRDEDFVTVTKSLTDGVGVNVILDMIGGNYLQRNVETLANEGRLVMIATQSGTRGELDVLKVMQRRLHITGSTLRGRSAQFKRHVRDQLLSHVWPFVESGKIRPVVDRAFQFEEAVDAHAYMERGGHIGKIVLRVS
jgi:putative PIG3 family NAD(P)H quinone oxidoreductase